MYKHILIPTDGSPLAAKAVSAGLDYAREAGARVTLFTAVPEYRPPSECEVMARQVVSLSEHESNSERLARGALADSVQKALRAGLHFETDYAQSDRPWEAIIDAARRNGCDAIFMASHGRTGLSAVLHGSQTRQVLNRSNIPTMVYR